MKNFKDYSQSKRDRLYKEYVDKFNKKAKRLQERGIVPNLSTPLPKKNFEAMFDTYAIDLFDRRPEASQTTTNVIKEIIDKGVYSGTVKQGQTVRNAIERKYNAKVSLAEVRAYAGLDKDSLYELIASGKVQPEVSQFYIDMNNRYNELLGEGKSTTEIAGIIGEEFFGSDPV